MARRILFLTAQAAFPAVSGADLRNWQNAFAATQAGEVKLVSLTKAGEVPLSTSRLTTGDLGADDCSAHQSRPGASSIDLQIDRGMIEGLSSILSDWRPDIVVLEHLGLHPFIPSIQLSGARLVFDMHNVESDLANQIRWRRDWFGFKRRRDSRVIAALEADVIAAADCTWVCSPQDAERLAARGLGRALVVPNGLPRSEQAPRRLPAEPPSSSPEIIFVGHLGYKPNIVACERLARRIFPRLRGALPGVHLTLAGRQPARRVRRLATKDIRVVANPDDVASLLAAAHIAVVPLREGGGTRFKIIEAMAWGVPVVATPLAAEGLGLREGHDIVLGETDRALAAQIIRLWQNTDKRTKIRACAHATAWERFGPDGIEDAVLAALSPCMPTDDGGSN